MHRRSRPRRPFAARIDIFWYVLFYSLNTRKSPMRKIPTLLLAITLAMGSGLASAQTSTSTEKTVSTPLGSVNSTTTTTHDGPAVGKTVEQKKSTTEHPDGSVTTDHSKTVTKSD
jgi:hypothetical protein